MRLFGRGPAADTVIQTREMTQAHGESRSFFGRIFPSLESRILSLSELDALMDRVYYGLPTTSGEYVNVDTAMQSVAVWACVQAITKAISALPFKVYQLQKDGSKIVQADHRVYDLLHDAPNEEETPLEFWEVMFQNRLTWGNAYAQIITDDHGARELWPLDPSRVKARRDPDSNELYFSYRQNAQKNKVFRFKEIFHLKGRSFDGVTGLSPIAYSRNTIGLAIAAQEYGARYFGNGANPGGVIQTKGKLSPEAAKRLKADWERAHSGTSNAHRVAILEEGLTFVPHTIPAEDSQFLLTQKATKEDIASIFGVPPHKIGLLEHTNRASIEEQNIEWVVDTILPECVRAEQAVQRDLIRIGEGKRGIYGMFDISGLLRGNQAARYAAYVQGRQWGWLSANDVRASEGMNPLPDQQGNIYMVPLNMGPAGSLAATPAVGGPTANPNPDNPPGGIPDAPQEPPPKGVGLPIWTTNPNGKASLKQFSDWLEAEPITPRQIIHRLVGTANGTNGHHAEEG